MSSTLHEITRPLSLGHLVHLRMARHLTQIAAEHQASRQHRMAIFANDLIGIQINQFGLYERDELTLLFDFLKPLLPVFAAGTALDIGANIGNHAMYFSKRFQSVHAFEPNPSTFELLRFNAQWATNVQVHRFGLGNQPGDFDLIENSTNLGGSSILIGDKGKDSVVSIEVRTLDGLSIDTTDLCFVKIDVDGFEAAVIQGATDTLRLHQPVVVLEQHESELAGGTSPALSLLTSLGYGFCWQESPPPPRSWLGRRLLDLKHIAFGVQQRVVTGAAVPRTNHSMLVAVPQRFQAALGMTR